MILSTLGIFLPYICSFRNLHFLLTSYKSTRPIDSLRQSPEECLPMNILRITVKISSSIFMRENIISSRARKDHLFVRFDLVAMETPSVCDAPPCVGGFSSMYRILTHLPLYCFRFFDAVNPVHSRTMTVTGPTSPSVATQHALSNYSSKAHELLARLCAPPGMEF